MFNKTTTSAAEEEQITDSGENLGDFLKTARRDQGLNLAVIADETRINLKSLIALEENNRAGLPADVFSRGFVKLYAAYLKLDPQEAIRLYDKQWGGGDTFADPFTPPKPSPSWGWPDLIVSLLLVALFFGIRIYYPGGHDDTTGDQGGAANIAVLPPPGAGHDETNPPGPTAADLAPPAATTGAGEAAPEEAVRPPMDQAETEGANSQPPPAAVSRPPYKISLQVKEETTVKLTIDKQAPVEKTLAAGSSQTWQASQVFDMTLDRASGVTLTVNDAPVAIPAAEAGQTVTIHRP